VHEVESGKRPRNADLVIENNRVQVSGALGVMEINGILCDMIFKNNIARHDFYIEESYVISWMFPYLAPHGLIMQIRQERGPIPPENMQDDMEFWDWYTRRLMRDERFRRDIVAQKSFSKLRSAIGGLYAYNGARANAEQAFQEARILYPVSPEANFRLVQEILLQQGRFDEAYDIIDTYNKADYNNERGKSVLEWIANMRNINKKIQDLLTKSSATGALDPNSSYEIGMCYRELGNVEAAARYIEPLAFMTNLPKELMFAVGVNLSSFRRHESAVRAMDQVANNLSAMPAQQLIDMVRVYEAAQRPDRMVAPLARYLKIRPGDWKAWLDLATLYVLNKQDVNAKSSLKKAIELGREEAIKAASSSEILRPMLPQVIQQRSGKEQQQPFPFMRR
jgi:tetratricopeptide (TPR) repeat protein